MFSQLKDKICQEYLYSLLSISEKSLFQLTCFGHRPSSELERCHIHNPHIYIHIYSNSRWYYSSFPQSIIVYTLFVWGVSYPFPGVLVIMLEIEPSFLTFQGYVIKIWIPHCHGISYILLIILCQFFVYLQV